jgi:DNA polymerase V
MLRPIQQPRNEYYDPIEDPGKVTGFSSPAQDYEQKRLDITQQLIIDPTNTHFFYAEGDQLKAFDIEDGDILVVDTSLPRIQGTLVICFSNGDFTVKEIKQNQIESKYQLWGVITWICKPKLKKQIHVRIGRL